MAWGNGLASADAYFVSKIFVLTSFLYGLSQLAFWFCTAWAYYPLTNLAISALAFILLIIGAILSAILGLPGIILNMIWVVFSINIIIGAFNLIPIGVLDGAKILRWNKIVYAVMVMIFIPAVLFVFLFRFLTIG